MSKNNENAPPNYEHIKALVRGLHITKNVARPSIHQNENHHQLDAAAQHTIKSTNPPITDAQLLFVKQLESLTVPSDVDDDESYCDEGDRKHIGRQRLSHSAALLPQHLSAATRDRENVHDADLHVPSVVITDVNEPLDLLSSTQRRFSQLYSGLRRFSASHTVVYAIKTKTNQFNSNSTKT